jgi:hypothetical protein
VSTLASRASAPAAAALALGAYWAVTPFIDPNIQTETLRGVQAVVMTVNSMVFIFAFHRAFAAGVPNSVRRFYLGLILWASAADGGAVWRLLWHMAGRGPDLDWMLTAPASSFLIWAEIVGVFLIISGPNARSAETVKVPNPPGDHINWQRISITAALCVAVSYVVVFARVEADQLHAFLATIRRWISPS